MDPRPHDETWRLVHLLGDLRRRHIAEAGRCDALSSEASTVLAAERGPEEIRRLEDALAEQAHRSLTLLTLGDGMVETRLGALWPRWRVVLALLRAVGWLRPTAPRPERATGRGSSRRSR